MSSTHGGSADVLPAPDTFKLTDRPRNCWYAATYDVELRDAAQQVWHEKGRRAHRLRTPDPRP